MSNALEIGPHRFDFQPPALVYLSFVDNIDDAHAATVIEACGRSTAKKPFAIVCHTPGMKNVTPRARKVFADGFKKMPLVAAAFVDASIRTRAIVTFVVTAINVFRSKKMAFAFFDREEEAKTWAITELATWTE